MANRMVRLDTQQVSIQQTKPVILHTKIITITFQDPNRVQETLKKFQDDIWNHISTGWFLQGEIVGGQDPVTKHRMFSQQLVQYRWEKYYT